MEYFASLDHVLQAFIATLFTWGLTALGAGLVFLTSGVNRKFLDMMLGFAAGVMIAASYFSLLKPAIEMTEAEGGIPWLPAVVGFTAGGLVLFLIDKVLPHLHIGFPQEETEGIRTNWQRSVLLMLAITIHNIPEGLAVGVAFGALAADIPSATFAGAVSLAVGIGLQNFPEGAAVSFPLVREGMSRTRSFFWGQLSGIVEPVAAVCGALLVVVAKPVLPYALSFAAGAMIFVVVEELIPESQLEKNTDLATLATMFGFAFMMMLDLAFA
ncbi:MAG TPA: ZIP family metal transporter [Acidobacteriota bacterium]|jgi:ZIP family zinc transporter|nr:ZIP family metal transporter [Acidobacteriota bacterium]HNT17419.1 ZIP family metal transporter [Acidobacteriota bacterium]HPA26224.1 ZIP family metal transporter [Acidobacteriota bacterium]HQO18783.1 ZIP family metal transporter [Acidobacteriota bacterium]HQQ46672.1 ZIP family metal transporter [Acidobacteriota bacterium]